MRLKIFLARFAVPAVAFTLVLGCSDTRQALSDDNDPTLTGPGLYPSVSVSTSGGRSMASLSLVQVPGGVQLASYQGEITYDAGALALEEATLPEGVEGAVNEATPGHLRFVGTSLEAMGDAPLLRLRFRKGAAPTREMFSVRFEEVTTAGDLSDVTASVKNEVLLFRTNR